MSDWYRSKPPRRADGIRARSQRGKFARSWWAGRWIAALERLVDGARLARGRRYARAGQVLAMEIAAGLVTARVQGSRKTPYRVTLRLSPLSHAAWEKVLDVLAGRALYSARLLEGEMPEDVEGAFQAGGVSLLPAARGDLETDCTCPDWANPCKHVAAVHYLLGERFDEDPFLMFELRGRSREAVAEGLCARRSAAVAEPAREEPPGVPDQAEEEAWRPFWELSEQITSLPLSFDVPPIAALPVKRLGRPAWWRGEPDFLKWMEALYRAIGRFAHDLLMAEET